MAEQEHPMLARAQTWLQPVPGAKPGGVSARLEPAYEKLVVEVAKLDAATGGEVDWKGVAAASDELLRSRSKDLILAAYLSRALLSTEGVAGLGTGLHLFAGMAEQYWENGFPEVKRMRARVNAAQWLVDKAVAGLGGVDAGRLDPELLGVVTGAARRLGEVVRSRMGDAAPAIGPLVDSLERLRLTAEASRPPPPPPPAAAPAPGPAAAPPAPAAAPAPSPPPAVAAQTAEPTFASIQDAVDYLRPIGVALSSAGALARRADPTDPLGFRVLRTGLWLHLVQAPPATAGKTTIPPPPEGLRSSLQLMAQNQRWAALLEEAESALNQHRFWLDLHRHSFRALAALGPAHQRAADAVASELRALLGRMPALPQLAFGDGSPLADPETRAWIDAAVLQAPRAAPAATGGGGEPSEDELAEARSLLSAGRVPEGLAAFSAVVSARPSGRSRFLARLALARAAAAAGLHPVAKGTFEALDAEAQLHRLDEWEPALAVECLKGYLAAARALAKDPRAGGAELTSPYQRLCRLDPAAAHEVWP